MLQLQNCTYPSFIQYPYARELRKSKFRAITDKKLFDLVDSIISKMNSEKDASYRYTLHRNDVTHIKYEEVGGEWKILCY